MNRPTAERLEETIIRLRKLKAASTEVVEWYPHGTGDGYHLDTASVRGPFGRWFLVQGGDNGMGDPAKYPAPVANLYDDAKYCAAAMNSVPYLLDEIVALKAERDEEGKHSLHWQQVSVEIKKERDQLKEQLAIADQIIAERNRILEAYPCPYHGHCVPHVLELIREQEKQLAEAKEALGKISRFYVTTQSLICGHATTGHAVEIARECLEKLGKDKE